MEPGMTTIPLAAAAIVAIFAMGTGFVIGIALAPRSEEPEAEPSTETTIETRRRMNDA
jgi:hypothetical protein